MSNIPSDNNPDVPAAGEPARTSGKAIASLILGILSLFCCTVFTGVPAIIFGSMGLGEIGESRGRLTGRGLAIAGMMTGGIGSTIIFLGVLLALLLPAVQSARTAARRAQSTNYLQQIGVALHSYHAEHHAFPAATVQDDAGNPLFSWRVAILPNLDELALYKEFTQDESWNGPDNKNLVAKEPFLYVPLDASNTKPGETHILGIVGPDAGLMTDRGVRVEDFRDGTSQTILAVELAGGGIVWSEPRDVTVEEFIEAMQRRPTEPGLRPVYPGGVLCLFADGSVRLISNETPPETLRAMCTRSGGDAVPASG